MGGVQSLLEVNGAVVEVVAEAQVEGRWVVGFVGHDGNTFSVAQSKLSQIRPAA